MRFRDPQQRQLLEVVYEGFENAGVTLEQASGSLYGCFVGSYAVGKRSDRILQSWSMLLTSRRLSRYAIP